MKLVKNISSIITVSAIPGMIVAIFFTYAMIQHNSQGEAFDTINEKYDYVYIVKFFSLNFIIIFSAVFLLLVIARLISFLFDAIFGEEPPEE